MTRWERLERYAVWRQRRFPLLRLPDDVIELILRRFLTHWDVCAVLKAIIGTRIDVGVQVLPRGLQTYGTLAISVCHLDSLLRSLADECLLVASTCACVRVFVDWSPFASLTPPTPVAEYQWRLQQRPHASVSVYPEALVRALALSCAHRRPCGYLAMHRCCNADQAHVETRAMMQMQVGLLPAWIFEDTRSVQGLATVLAHELRRLRAPHRPYTSL